jgi:hypothetical protein
VAVDFQNAIVWIKWIGAHKQNDASTLAMLNKAADMKPVRTEADYEAALEHVAAL